MKKDTSDILYSILIIYLVSKYIITKDIKWIIFIVSALLIISIWGYSIRNIMADNNIWSVRPNLKILFFKPKYKSGLFSLHAASSAFIVFVLLMEENKDYLFISLALLLTLIISYLRISDKLHSLKQIVIGLFIDFLFRYLVSKGTSYSKRGTILFLTFIILVSLYLNYESFHQTYIELKNTNEDLPTWFDPSLIELYHKKIKNNSKVGFRNILLRCFYLKLQQELLYLTH